jgi:hypothetical protein
MVQAVIILFFHWVGDFLFQTTSMATHKSKSNYWLSVHVFYYTVGISPLWILIMWSKGSFTAGLLPGLLWLVVAAGLHWITDYFTSRQTSRLYAEKKYYGFPAFFSVIGLDQWIHAACLLLSYEYLI